MTTKPEDLTAEQIMTSPSTVEPIIECIRMLHSPINRSAQPSQEFLTVSIEDRGSSFLARALVRGKKDEWPTFDNEWTILMESDRKSNAFESLKDHYNRLRFMIPRTKDGVMQGILEAERNRSNAL